MATYKVIQDIEAEDKLLGPLTLKGFIYAIIAVFCAFINLKLVTSTGLGPIRWLFVIVFLLPMLLFGVLASPLGRHQPTEVWLLARIRFLLKPRKRLWSQTGLLHLVTITAPKKAEKQRTKGLREPESDRLVAPTTLAATSPGIDIHPADDIMDEQNNPTAQYLAGLMQQADADRKVNVANRLSVARQAVSSAESGGAVKTDGKTVANPVTATRQADTLELAQSGNDFSVATLSKLANRRGQFQQVSPSEVLLQLH